MAGGGWAPPAKIEELYEQLDVLKGNKFAGVNRPTAGARVQRGLPKGGAPLQLYSLATPNGQKIGVVLEELGIDYDAHVVGLGGAQFDSGFVDVNPNSKIPCAVDHAPAGGGPPLRLFESASIALYLCEKHGRFIPKDARGRAECMNWVFWQMAGQGPMTGNFGHFMVYAPPQQKGARDYGAARYGMEVQRLCSVLDRHLASRRFLCGDEYTLADMICLPWFQVVREEATYRHPSGVNAKGFLSIDSYAHAGRWADELLRRPQVRRGLLVCRKHGKPWLADDRFKHLAKL